MTPERKEAIWAALRNMAAGDERHRTLTTFCIKVQDAEVRAAMKPFTHEGPYGRLLDSDHDTLTFSRWQAFEMRDLINNCKSLVMPLLTYLFHALESRFRADTPTLLVLDEGWLFLDNPVFAPKLREWLKTLRSFKVYVVFASQSLSDVANSALRDTILDCCPNHIYLPNPNAMETETAKLYHTFGLNDRQIEIIARATPKQDYYYTSPLGNRLFSLSLGAHGLAYCAATGDEAQKKLADLWGMDAQEFNSNYLQRRAA